MVMRVSHTFPPTAEDPDSIVLSVELREVRPSRKAMEEASALPEAQGEARAAPSETTAAPEREVIPRSLKSLLQRRQHCLTDRQVAVVMRDDGEGEFVVPYRRYAKSLERSFAIGDRVRMRFGDEEDSEGEKQTTGREGREKNEEQDDMTVEEEQQKFALKWYYGTVVGVATPEQPWNRIRVRWDSEVEKKDKKGGDDEEEGESCVNAWELERVDADDLSLFGPSGMQNGERSRTENGGSREDICDVGSEFSVQLSAIEEGFAALLLSPLSVPFREPLESAKFYRRVPFPIGLSMISRRLSNGKPRLEEENRLVLNVLPHFFFLLPSIGYYRNTASVFADVLLLKK